MKITDIHERIKNFCDLFKNFIIFVKIILSKTKRNTFVGVDTNFLKKFQFK